MNDIPPLSTNIEGLFLGQVRHLGARRTPSAIGKTDASGPQKIGSNGFVGDAQADLQNHGGTEKAIHHYAADHYSAWIAEQQIPENTRPGSFGENIATRGMTEENLCIGDVLKLGTAVVQISQGRQPCWKLAEHTKNPRMAYLFQKSGRTGWYYRVLENGEASVSDSVILLERPQPNWSVKRVTSARLSRQVTPQVAEALADLPELAEDWRAAFRKMAGGDLTEDTSRRLQGPAD